MKKFCDSLMKLNPSLPYGNDFSPVILALFLKEYGYGINKKYNIGDYVFYLYRFYSDEDAVRKIHYNKIINEIAHYTPGDIFAYAKSVLEYVASSTGLIVVGNTEFVLANCPEDISKYIIVVDNVINTLVTKYLGKEYCSYKEKISDEEYVGQAVFENESRVFNRALEHINYCFICDEYHRSNLRAVRLKEMDEFVPGNYLILCEQHAEMYSNGRLIIRKNGYPYIDGKRNYQHLEIGILKRIRPYLSEMDAK